MPKEYFHDPSKLTFTKEQEDFIISLKDETYKVIGEKLKAKYNLRDSPTATRLEKVFIKRQVPKDRPRVSVSKMRKK